MTEFQFLRSIFYTLKRTFPRQIKLINKTEQEVDIVTGIVTPVEEEKTIRRAVVLHRSETNLIQKIFGHDAPVRLADRYVLIAQKDLNGYAVEKATTVEYDDEYWSIVDQDNYSREIIMLFLNRIAGDVNPGTPTDSLNNGPFDEVDI